jgi:nucleotide-binding universal stress UspA family protein
LLGKSTFEIHENLEGEEGHKSARVRATFGSVLVQIVLLDVVFSLDSVITDVGMVDEISVMIAAVTIAILVMLVSAEDAALPLQAALRRHELFVEERARELESELGHILRIRVREGEAASVILEVAEEGGEPTLTAVGRRGLGRINRLRLGSVSADVLRSAAGPVLIVPAPDGA